MPTQFNPFLAPDEKLEEARRRAMMTQQQRHAMDASVAEQTAVEGVETLGRGLLGLPMSPSANRSGAAAEIRALTQKVTPGTPDFYKQAAAIYQKHGLTAEAERMTQLLNEVEFGKGESQEVLKLQRVRDYLQKRIDGGDTSVAPAIEAVNRRLGTYGQQGTPPSDPEFVKLLNEYEKAVAAGQGDRAAQIKLALDAWIKSKGKEGSGEMTAYQQVMSDLAAKRETRAQVKDDAKQKENEEAAVTAMQSFIGAMDRQLQNGQALIGHAGLPWITGARAGSALGSAVSSFVKGEAANAKVFMDTLQAQAFLQSLQELRQSSKSGASGLGQLTEREGDKIQAARMALRPQQETSQFKVVLAEYLRQLSESRNQFAAALQAQGAKVPPSPPAITTRKSVSDIAPGARPTRPGAAPTPPAGRKFKSTRIDG